MVDDHINHIGFLDTFENIVVFLLPVLWLVIRNTQYLFLIVGSQKKKKTIKYSRVNVMSLLFPWSGFVVVIVVIYSKKKVNLVNVAWHAHRSLDVMHLE